PEGCLYLARLISKARMGDPPFPAILPGKLFWRSHGDDLAKKGEERGPSGKPADLHVLPVELADHQHCSRDIIDEIATLLHLLFYPAFELLPADQVVDQGIVEVHGRSASFQSCFCQGGDCMVQVRSLMVSPLRISAAIFPLSSISGHRGLLLYCDDMANP